MGVTRSRRRCLVGSGVVTARGTPPTYPAALGAYTAQHEILRANSRGMQARIKIENSKTLSPFAYIVTGYGIRADKFVQSLVKMASWWVRTVWRIHIILKLPSG